MDDLASTDLTESLGKESKDLVQEWLNTQSGMNKETSPTRSPIKKEVKVEVHHQPPDQQLVNSVLQTPQQHGAVSTVPNTGHDGAVNVGVNATQNVAHHDARNSAQQQESTCMASLQHDHGQKHDLTPETSNVTALTKMLLEQHVRSELPKRTLQPFMGDPLQFTTFIRSFEYSIEGKHTSDRERLLFLEQLTRGEANGLVKGCMYMPDDSGYQRAKQLLQKRYGNVHRIAEAYLAKMRTWPSIMNEDSTGIQNLSLFLTECKHTMESLGYTNELHSTANIRVLVEKLPYKLRYKWRQQVDNIEEELGKIVSFDDFCKFLEKQSRILNNAAFGQLAKEGKREGKSGVQKPKKMLSTNTLENPETPGTGCSYCNGTNHKVESYFKLGKKPIAERLKHLRDSGVCFGCLKRSSHRCKDCTNKLSCSKCSRKHPTVLHMDTPSTVEKSGDPSMNKGKENSKKEEMVTSTACHRIGAGDCSSPCIIPVKVHAKSTGIIVETLAYLDTGSDATFCTDKLRQKLNMKGRPTKLNIQTMTEVKKVNSTVLEGLDVCDMDMLNCISLPRVYTQEKIPADVADVITPEQVTDWPYLEEVNVSTLEDEANAHIGLLIGNNVPQVFEPWQVVHSRDGGPYVCKGLLGWSVYGVNTGSKTSSPITITRTRVEETLDQQLVKLFNYDFTERIIDDQPEKSIQDKQFLTQVRSTIKCTSGHYEIGLLLNNDEVNLPNNKAQAAQRAAHLKTRFKKNQKFYEDYNTFMNNTISNNYASKVPTAELDGPEGRTWYIPHHGVYHPRKHKLRVVFDCGASFHGQSLNKALNQGPDLTNSLVGVVMRFRQDSVAIMADIEGMFQQVKVPQRDMDLQRFLWWPEGNVELPLEEYRMGVHIFGATSSPACANFALRRAAEDGSTIYHQQVINAIYNNFYMDDCLVSVAQETEAIKLAHDLRKICIEGGFKLTKWVSNNRNVLQSIQKEERAKEVKVLDLDKDNLPSDRALGILWSAHTDSFGFQIAVKDKPATRRGILSVVSSIYDPLGFAAPATLPVKEILQDLCRHRMSRDDEIPTKHHNKWIQWLAELLKLENLAVSRCYKPPDFGEIKNTQLHHFSDASQSGYGTVSYLRIENSAGDIHCAFVIGKARVAPLKQITIPRLELTAAAIAVKVNNMIQKQLEIQIDDTIFWTDSYIQSCVISAMSQHGSTLSWRTGLRLSETDQVHCSGDTLTPRETLLMTVPVV